MEPKAKAAPKKPDERKQIIRSVYGLFHKLVKIAEKAESADDPENQKWALTQLQTMIQGKLKGPSAPIARPVLDPDDETFVLGAPGIGGPPPAKRPRSAHIPDPDKEDLAKIIAGAQGRG